MDVKKCFEPIASVVDVQIKKTSDSVKYPLNYAFVRMGSRIDAQNLYRALTSNESLANIVINSEHHKIRLGWARTNTTLHISHLDNSITEETLYGLFSQYGELIAAPSFSGSANTNGAVIIHNSKTDHETNSPCTYATITFMNRENAEEARVNLNGTLLGTKYISFNLIQLILILINCRSIRVEWNRKKQSQTKMQAYNTDLNLSNMLPSSNVISIYVQFESNDASIVRVNEQFLMHVFEAFGGVTDCYIKSSNYSECGRKQHGYGFIHFENTYFGQQCARTAAQVVGTSGRFVYNGVILRSEVSRNFMRTTGEYNNCEVDNKEPGCETNSDLSKYVYQEHDAYGQQKKQSFDSYQMMNNGIMFCSPDGLSNSPCFYSTVMDMQGNQYLIPIPTPRMTAPVIIPPQPWNNAYLDYQPPIMQIPTVPSIPSQIDYKSIASINPAMMISNIHD